VDTILKTYNLTKRYKNINVVDNINMTIEKGEIYGLLGENGAGKTTTLKMVMGLTKITSGTIEIFGKKINSNDYLYKNRIGAIVENPGFYPNLSALETLEIHRRLMGVQNRKQIDEVLELVELTKDKHKIVKTFSLGMKQRLGIARVLLQNPELLILDEPTNALDPVGISEFRDIIIDLNKNRNVTILISSHILGEIQKIATKIGIIHKGILLEEFNYRELEERNKSYLQITVNDDKKASMILEKECGINQYKIYENGVIRILEKIDEVENINKQLVLSGVGLKELKVNSENLEDYFLRLIGGEDNV